LESRVLAAKGFQRNPKLADMLYQVPANPPTTDLTVFLRDAPPKLD
jgi:hypothetical protein